MPRQAPLLTDYELMQPAVAKILKHFEERLAKLRIDNDSFDAHDSIRGRIAEIKDFHKLLRPKKPKDTNAQPSAI